MLEFKKDIQFQKNLLWLNGALPGILLLIDLYRGRLGANPPEAIIRTTGVVAILFLVLTLAVTPIANTWSQGWLVRHRRWLGLWCFYYALVHMLSYALFDKGFKIHEITADIAKRPFILLGFLAFLILIPLAGTSTNQMIKRLGNKRWKALHRLTYLAAPLVAIHYWLIVKSDVFYPGMFALLFVGLLLYRGVKSYKARA